MYHDSLTKLLFHKIKTTSGATSKYELCYLNLMHFVNIKGVLQL